MTFKAALSEGCSISSPRSSVIVRVAFAVCFSVIANICQQWACVCIWVYINLYIRRCMGLWDCFNHIPMERKHQASAEQDYADLLRAFLTAVPRMHSLTGHHVLTERGYKQPIRQTYGNCVDANLAAVVMPGILLVWLVEMGRGGGGGGGVDEGGDILYFCLYASPYSITYILWVRCSC